ncbi:6-phosphofructokinase [bacterium]|nr:6-phosphofructokinase [candidate division CSSED10-310 bacterium]
MINTKKKLFYGLAPGLHPTRNDSIGILVGGGPAPGINGVISSVTIEALKHGWKPLGIEEGFRWISQGNTDHVRELTIDTVSRIHYLGGSIIGTSRVNPTRDPEKMKAVLATLRKLNLKYLVTIGGDDTAYSAYRLQAASRGLIRVAHVPKTIDNDLPLPGGDSTFGFQTARHYGVEIIQALMEDARTTKRWYFVVTMGRKAGHLALGIGKSAGATLTIIGEEFSSEAIHLQSLSDILEGAIIKRLAMGREYGVAILAEGLLEKIPEEDLARLGDIEHDTFGHIRFAELDLGSILKNQVRTSLAARGIEVTIVSKDIGYELRCATPIPFDCEYTRDLGYAAGKFLVQGGTGAMVTRQAGKMVPIYLEDIIDSATGKTRVRFVNIHTESYEVARRYMIRIDRADFEHEGRLQALAEAAGMSEEEFRERFEYLSSLSSYRPTYL